MLGLDLGLSQANAQAWWPEGATFAADFVNDRYMINGVAVPAEAAFSLSRSSAKFAETSPGRWGLFAPGPHTRGYKGLSLEPAATYEPLNAALTGTVAGIVGAGGARPTGWPAGAMAGLDVEIIGTGYEGDMPYLRLRFFGTTTGTDLQWMFDNSTIAAASAQSWTAGMMLRHVSGSTDGITPSIRIVEQENATFLAANQTDFTWQSSFDWRTVTRQFDQPTTNRARTRFRMLMGASQAVDLTLDLASPVTAQSPQSLSPLLTSGSTQLRLNDEANLNLPAGVLTVTMWLENEPPIATTASGSTPIPVAGATHVEKVFAAP